MAGLAATTPPVGENPSPRTSPVAMISEDYRSIYKSLIKQAQTAPTECSHRIRNLISDTPFFTEFQKIVPLGHFYFIAAICESGRDETASRVYLRQSFHFQKNPAFAAQALVYLSESYIKENRYPEALEVLRRIDASVVTTAAEAQYYCNMALAIHHADPSTAPLPYLIKATESTCDTPKALEAKASARALGKAISEEELTRAIRYSTTGRHDDTESVVNDILEMRIFATDSTLVNAYFFRLRAHMKRGNLDEAKKDAKSLMTYRNGMSHLEPLRLVRFQFYTIALQYHSGAFTSVTCNTESLLRLDLRECIPLHINALAIRGIALHKLGRHREALEALSTVRIDSIPTILTKEIEVKNRASEAYSISHSHVKSETLLGQIEELAEENPGRITLGIELGVTRLSLNQRELAFEAFHDAYSTAYTMGHFAIFRDTMIARRLSIPLIEIMNDKAHTSYLNHHRADIARTESTIFENIMLQTRVNHVWVYDQLKFISNLTISPNNRFSLMAKIYYNLGVLEETSSLRKRQYFTICSSPTYREYLSVDELSHANKEKSCC